MRKQYWPWMILVFGIVGTAYGTHLLIYHWTNSQKFSIWSLVLLIFGAIALAFSIVLMVMRYIANKKQPVVQPVIEPETEEGKPIIDEPSQEEEPQNEIQQEEQPETEIEDEQEEEHPIEEEDDYEEPTPRPMPNHYRSYSTVYVKKVGYGPILRVEGNRIIDMRSNTYYHLENGFLYQDGYGVRYEIRGNQIRDAFGGYLYELSGSNINKVFGGFFASISGNYIATYNLSDKFEMTDSLSKQQLLAVTVLIFGKY